MEQQLCTLPQGKVGNNSVWETHSSLVVASNGNKRRKDTSYMYYEFDKSLSIFPAVEFHQFTKFGNLFRHVGNFGSGKQH